jgi:hypothetical protein
MSYSKSIATLFVVFVCTTAPSAHAGQRSGGRAPSQGSAAGRAAPRINGGGVRVAPRVIGGIGYRPYYPYYRPGFALGFGYGYYGYPYAYGYPYYGYGYGYPYGYAYPAYGYGYGYAAPGAGYVSAGYGGVRIQGAPRDAQVFADGYYVGIVDDFDGTLQHLNLPAGAHEVEIRIPGRQPSAFDVNVQPGQTVTYHANVR